MASLNTKVNASAPASKVAKAPFVASRSKAPGRQAIALISDHGDPAAEIGKEEAGGQNVYVRQVGEALANLGWQVDMFTRKVRSSDPSVVQHSPHCRTVRLVAGPEEFIPRDQLFDYMPEFVEAFQTFQSKEGTNYPLIHTNYWMSAWIGLQLRKESNIQLVHTYHSVGAVKYQSVPNRPAIAETRLSVEREILEQANCVVATSPQEEEILRTLVSEQGCIEVIPCGTDIENFSAIPKPEARAALGFAPDEAIVLYVGRFDPRKGIETLVRAFAQLKAGVDCQMASAGTSTSASTLCALNPDKLRLVIVGGSDPTQSDGSERERIGQLVREFGLANQTHFAGRIGHDLLPLYYTAADVCVIPSHYEPFGLVAIEAMACGTPVVASAVGGLNFSVAQEETGLLVPPHDTTAFARAIDRILTDEVWARKLRRQAPIRVQENFSWPGVATRLGNLYRCLLAQSISHEELWSPGQASSSAAATVAAAASASAVVTSKASTLTKAS
ncbi:MAG: glycosyltransferase family 1 protein [Leptolyngbyaceae cyanobacterium RU_5_1]|nr:glycosyltransferase family 1 protein [Leptolyngbyaceae cyanobacterium RU_5_1]